MKNKRRVWFAMLLAPFILMGCNLAEDNASKEKEDPTESAAPMETEDDIDPNVDMDGNRIFDEEIDSTSGWETTDFDYEPDVNQTESEVAAASAVLTDCMQLTAGEDMANLGVSISEASAVCQSGAVNLKLNWHDANAPETPEDSEDIE